MGLTRRAACGSRLTKGTSSADRPFQDEQEWQSCPQMGVSKWSQIVLLFFIVFPVFREGMMVEWLQFKT